MEEKAKIQDIIERIADLKRKRVGLRQGRREHEDRIVVIQARTRASVVTATDAKGRARYTNEQTRQAALALKLQEDEDYQQFQKKMRESEDEEALLAIEIERLESTRRLLMAMLPLLHAQAPTGNNDL